MITIENTSYGYKSNPLIFNNISLEIGNGIYGLLGENGVGKTTLMHLICGLLFPKNGKCSIDGRNTAERQSEGLARYFFLPEELQMPTESIASFAARHSVFYPHFNQEEFELNLEELKIDRKQKLSSISYGQQKKAMLAYAFALHTPYILLDEPTNGLDITSRQALKRIISRSMDDESTLLISTHQAHDFENLLDHLIILGKGEILLNRSLDEISNRLCILCILYDINRGGSYYGKQTSATEFSRYVLWFILMAPCLLETNFSKRSSTLDILLPASAFEKFLHIWIKYLLLLPLFCGLLIACLKGLLSLSGSEFLQYFATHITMFRIHNTQILTYVILHASAFIGYFAFSRQVLLKSFTIFVGSMAVCIGIVTFVASLMPEARADGYWMDNIATWPNTNYPLSAGAQAIVTFCNYAAPISVLLGSWASSYFLLKEKQL